MTNIASTITISLADLRCESQKIGGQRGGCISDVRLTATHPQHGLLGTLKAYKIAPIYQLKGSFFELLDSKSAELSDFGAKVLDNNMNVYSKLVDDEYHKGTGCWGREMNEGSIMFIHELEVDRRVEHQGIGTRLLQELVAPNNYHVNPKTIIYCWPSSSRARSVDECCESLPPIVNFFRKFGFRRVGRTTYFAHTTDAQHPSRLLPASDDLAVDHYKFSRPVDEAMDRLRKDYPIHTAMNPPGLRSASTTEDIIAAIHTAYTQDPASVHIRDEQGLSPIHIAASKGNLEVVKTLLSLGDARDDILCRDNINDRNAMEAHEEHMQISLAVRQITIGPSECDSSKSDLTLQHLLKQAAGEDVGSLEDQLTKGGFGCICGQCRGGWLSPRVAHIMQLEAREAFYVGTLMVPMAFQKYRPACAWNVTTLPGTDYIPVYFRQNMYQSFYKGFISLSRALSRVIERDVIPTLQGIISEAGNSGQWYGDREVQHYVGKGGRVEYPVDYVVDAARKHMADEAMLEELEKSEAWRALPVCVNDMQFDLVRRRMGLSASQRWGPYYDEGDEDGPIVAAGLPGLPSAWEHR
ncbi:hypothetical protein BD626DRAFT_504273 [Schizophyllum amplum]|uniref:N-acetyltransferase domain-containing protein n=1 Tax=Schizophyllum amplum TaxID=97359 RepID=A0A550C6V0_9AGAR|nr:hypothetical protein BD626DRAFT_504273 [Auriculariopsis ampla]